MRLRRLLALAAVCLCSSVLASAADPATQLGLAESDLLAGPQVPEHLRRVARPDRLASGARGLWRVARTDWGGLQVQQTFYLAQGKVQRIELLLLPDAAAGGAGPGVFERVVATLQTALGPALLAGDVASWVAGGVDVAAYRTASAQGLQVRVVYKTRELRDASAL